MKQIFILLTILAISTAPAEDIYIAQTALGTDTGANAANAHAMTWFNTAGNWDTDVAADSKIGPGDTVHFVGTITSQATLQGSGTSGNRITILFETNALMTAPYWTNGAITAASKNFFTIDGGTNGRIEASANGTTRTFQVPSKGVYIDGVCNDLTIRNLIIDDMYVRTPGSTTDGNRWGQNIHILNLGNNVIIENCQLFEGDSPVNFSYFGGTRSNFIIRNNLIGRCNHGIGGGVGQIPSPASNLDNLQIYGNVIDDLDVWDGHPGLHLDGIIIFNDTQPERTGVLSNMQIYQNRIGPNIGWTNTAGIFLNHFAASQVVDMKIYNNLFLFKAGSVTVNGQTISGWNNGHIAAAASGNSIIANNTFVKLGTPGGGTQITTFFGTKVKNNLVLNGGYELRINPGQLVGASDYNIWEPGPSFIIAYSNAAGTGFLFANSLAAWQAVYGHDTHSTTAMPSLDANYVPTSTDTVARDKGTNLVAEGIPATDFYGNPRTGTWDIGAFEFQSGVAVTPTVSSASVNAAGTQFAIICSEPVVFGTGGNGGLSLTSNSGGSVTLGTPTISASTITWPITNRLIGAGEIITRTYAQPVNGIESSTSGLDLASFTGAAVTNSSTVGQVNPPQFSPVPGAYSSTQNVTITSSTPTATIRYTTNGVDPTASTGTLYSAPIPTNLTTTYKARAFATGLVDSTVTTGLYSIGDFILNSAWSNVAVTPQTGTFTWSFRASPSLSPTDAPMALSDHPATGYTDLAVIARFNPAGFIDAYNGAVSNYTAANAFPYAANQSYDFVVTVNVTSHTYSMTVVQAGGSTPATIATNYGFRSTQIGVTDLDNFAGLSDLGTVTVSNMIFTTASPTLSLTGIATNATGSQVIATFNSQPSFGTGGQGGFTVSASGGATTASSPTIGTNTITWTMSRAVGFGESVTATYVQPGNGIEAATGGSDLTSFAGQSVQNNSSIDSTAPTPNPSTFGIAPTATGTSTITMTATTSTDVRTPPVQYFFNETSGNAGGSDSGWQSSPTFTDTGLAAGTQYTYRVQVRDSATTPNVTTFSNSASATTRSVAGAHPANAFNVARANIVNP